jgi:hypothetical protein
MQAGFGPFAAVYTVAEAEKQDSGVHGNGDQTKKQHIHGPGRVLSGCEE